MKKTRWSKLLAAVIAFVMIVTMLPTAAVFASGESKSASVAESAASAESVSESKPEADSNKVGEETKAAESTASITDQDDLAGASAGKVGYFVVFKSGSNAANTYNPPYLYAWQDTSNNSVSLQKMTDVTDDYKYNGETTNKIYYMEVDSTYTAGVIITNSTDWNSNKLTGNDITPTSNTNISYSSTLGAYVIGINENATNGTYQLWTTDSSLLRANYTAVESIKLTYASGASSENTVTTSVNSTFMISSDVTPANATNQTLTWHIVDAANPTQTSSLVSLASQNGTFTAGSTTGSAVIYATINDNGTTVESNRITVNVVDNIAVESLTVSPAQSTIKKGQTRQLTVTASPEGAPNRVTWSSNNTSVATVNGDGLVTAVAAGAATITATSTSNPSVSASAVITVTDKTTLYFLAPSSWTAAYVYFFNGENDTYNNKPDDAMTLLDSSSYLYDGAAISDENHLFSIEVPEKDGVPYAYALFAKDSSWTNQWPVQGDNDSLATTPTNGGNAYTYQYKAGHTVSLRSLTSIAVTPKTSTITSSGTVRLTATGTYEGGLTRDISGAGVTWTSSNPSVATVTSAGLVRPVSQGTVTITAASATDSSIYDTATVTVEDAQPTSVTIADADILAGTTVTLTPSYEPENVNPDTLGLHWEVTDGTEYATVDEDGVVTGVANGTATVKVTVLNPNGTDGVSDTATIRVTAHENRLYFYAALSKLSYTVSADANRNMPNDNGDLYAYVWNTSSDGAFKKMTSLGATTANGRTYADGDIYYVDLDKTYQHVIFVNQGSFDGMPNNPYGRRTDDLDIPTNLTNPCFYAGSGDTCVYDNQNRPGYWDSAFKVYDPEKVTGTAVVAIRKTTSEKPSEDTHIEANTNTVNKTSNVANSRKITYLTSTLYDYYSDYELNGKEKSTDKNNWRQQSQRNWVTFREFDQALSDYYKAANTSKGDVVYTGHFQPDALDTNNEGLRFSNVAATLGLYGWDDNYLPFMTINNSNHAVDGTGGLYSAAAQGLVNQNLSGFVDGTLGTGVLNMEDNSTDLPHFNKSFLQGANSKNAILGSVYEDVQFPFTQEEDPYYSGVNYYTFDSARETVFLRTDQNGTKYLEDVGLYDNAKNVDSGSAASGTSSTYGYFPFNEDSSTTNAKTYDYGFGTKLEFKFTLNEKGDVESTGENSTGGKVPTIFKFSGDDDVWVYIDGKLVLDLGGSHGQVQGAINFSTDLDGVAKFPSKVNNAQPQMNVAKSSIAVSSTKSDNLNSQSTSLSSLNLADGEEHVLTLYYMERGMWESNMMVQFNMSVKKTINVEKEWKNYNGKDLADGKKKTVYAVIKRSVNGGEQEFVNVTKSNATDGSQYLITLNKANDWKGSYSVDEYQQGHENDSEYLYTYYVYEVQVNSSGEPQYEDGVPKIYSAGSKMQIGSDVYAVSGGGVINGSTGTITNTKQAGSTVSITKAWEGVPDSAASSILPANVYVKMYSYNAGQSESDAVAVTKETTEIKNNTTNTALLNDNNVITLNANNSWTASFEDLETTKTYFFKEVTDATGTTVKSTGEDIDLSGQDGKTYKFSISSETLNGAQTITNTLINPKLTLTLKKAWGTGTGESAKPSTVSFYLQRTGEVDGTSVTQYYNTSTFVTDASNASPITVSADSSWQTVLSDLDVVSDTANNKVWTYSVYLETSGTYSAVTTGGTTKLTIGNTSFQVAYGSTVSGTTEGSNQQTGEITVMNTQLPEITLNAKKIWHNDFNREDSTHTETVSAYLKRWTVNGEKEANVGYYKLGTSGVISWESEESSADRLSFTQENGYTVTLEHLPQYEDVGKTNAWHYALVDEVYNDGTRDYTVTDGKIVIGENEYQVTYTSLDASSEAEKTVSVTNKLIGKYKLPEAGGAGRKVLPWIIIGVALIAAAMVLKKRRAAK